MSISPTLVRAEKYCIENNHRFSEQRKNVLEVLAASKKAVGAYDIMQVLSSEDNMVKPPTVYRALDFWVKHGFAHKIESLNAYIACCNDHDHDHSLIMICNDCQQIDEVAFPHLPDHISATLDIRHFTLDKSVMEITGHCAQCSGA